MALAEWREALRRREMDPPADGDLNHPRFALVHPRFVLVHPRFVLAHPRFFLAGVLGGLPRGVRHVMIGVAALALMVAALWIGAGLGGSAAPPPSPAPVASPTAPAWIEIVKPLEFYSLEAPEFARAARTYGATRHREGGGRRDVLALGDLGGASAAIHLSLYRRGAEPYVAAPFFAALARHAADAGLSIRRLGLPAELPTRFGRFAVASLALEGPRPADARPLREARKPARSCVGFRMVADAPALTISGIACDDAPRDMTGERLACLLDRLDLASGGGDRALIEFFAASELKRDGACAGARMRPDTAHAPWLNDRPATPRKIARRH